MCCPRILVYDLRALNLRIWTGQGTWCLPFPYLCSSVHDTSSSKCSLVEIRSNQGRAVMEVFWQNLRYGFRVLAKSPGFAGMAILTLAIGIGANTSIFTVLNSVLLGPLPYEEPDRVVIVSYPFCRFVDVSSA